MQKKIKKGHDPRYLISSSSATLLHYAAEYGNVEIARYLVEHHGCNVNARNQLKETPLMLALEGRFGRTINFLLGCDADIYDDDVYGKSVLYRLFNNDADNNKPVSGRIIKMFFDKVVKDKRDEEFLADRLFVANCPIYWVLQLNNAKLTRLMLEKGTSINARQPRTDKTALHLAIERLDLDNVVVLLTYKANINAEDRDGKTPLSLLPNVFKVLEIVKMLLNSGSVLKDSDCARIPFAHVLVYGNRRAIGMYLRSSFDVWTMLRLFVDRFLCFYRHVRSLLDEEMTRTSI